MNKLVVGNLVHRPLRSIISALAVAIEVVMNGSRIQTSGIGMDMIVHPGASSALLNTSAAAAPIAVADVLRGLPHVQVVSPVNIKFTVGKAVENISGIDYDSYNQLKPFVYVAGGAFQHPNDILIDDLQAASGPGLKVGSPVTVLGHTFTVCGVVQHGKGGRKYIPLATMDEIDGNPGKASAFYLRTDDAATDAAKAAIQEQVRKEILTTDGLQDWSVQTIQEYLAALTPERMPGFNIALHVVIGIATIIGFLVIFQSMYTAVMERTREIGILKSMGAGKSSIVSVVMRETMLLAIVGIALGVGATYLLRTVLHHRFPTLAFAVTPDWVLKAVVIALLGAVFGALYPAFKAARKDPIDALSYE
jgi:putative ABC transport system permease protein